MLVINNKSGDFKPDFASLQYALSAMNQSKVKFSPEFLIQSVNSSQVPTSEEKVALEEIHEKLPAIAMNDEFPTIYSEPHERIDQTSKIVAEIEALIKVHHFKLNFGGENIPICQQQVSKGAQAIFYAIQNFKKYPNCEKFIDAIETAIKNKTKPSSMGFFRHFGGRDKTTAQLYQTILTKIEPLRALMTQNATTVPSIMRNNVG